MKYVPPGQAGSIVSVQSRYENFVGGKWLPPTAGKYRVNLSPATAKPICEVAESTAEDVELALDAAHAAKDGWGELSVAQRAEYGPATGRGPTGWAGPSRQTGSGRTATTSTQPERRSAGTRSPASAGKHTR
jgi:hypothetical protein